MGQRTYSKQFLFISTFIALFLAGCGDFFVSSGTLVSITVNPQNPTVQPGKTQQFTASGVLGDSTTQDVSSQVTWTSSNTNVATVDNAGLATAVALGTTSISAAQNGVTGSTTLTVTNQVITALAISPTNPTVPAGTTQQFTATATFSDNTTANVTNSVTWTSSTPAVASISNTGLASALATGSTTITATSGTVTATTTLNVTAF